MILLLVNIIVTTPTPPTGTGWGPSDLMRQFSAENLFCTVCDGYSNVKFLMIKAFISNGAAFTAVEGIEMQLQEIVTSHPYRVLEVKEYFHFHNFVSYSSLCIYFLSVVIFSCFLLFLSYVLSTWRKPSLLNRTSGCDTYEFGAITVGNNASLSVNKHYYILGIIFIVFDVELVFLFPWAYGLNANSYSEVGVVVLFQFFLMLGFFYELATGSLSWYTTPTYTLTGRCIIISNNRRKFLLYLNINLVALSEGLSMLTSWDAQLHASRFQFSITGLLNYSMLFIRQETATALTLQSEDSV